LTEITPHPPAVAFVARSGTGKTTLVEFLIREMRSRGYRIGALKHDAHRFEIDRPGKDSARFTAAGAEVMVLVSNDTVAMVQKPPQRPPLDKLLGECFTGLDLVLVEGYKTSDLPKVEIHRAELNKPLLCRGEKHDPHLLAVASDGPAVDLKELGVPVLDLKNPTTIADFLEESLL
jgi:molybdopterin-guanine dinucleotide biosynthesis protein MobB